MAGSTTTAGMILQQTVQEPTNKTLPIGDEEIPYAIVKKLLKAADDAATAARTAARQAQEAASSIEGGGGGGSSIPTFTEADSVELAKFSNYGISLPSNIAFVQDSDFIELQVVSPTVAAVTVGYNFVVNEEVVHNNVGNSVVSMDLTALTLLGIECLGTTSASQYKDNVQVPSHPYFWRPQIGISIQVPTESNPGVFSEHTVEIVILFTKIVPQS